MKIYLLSNLCRELVIMERAFRSSGKESNFRPLKCNCLYGQSIKNMQQYLHGNVEILERNINDLLRDLMREKKQSS